MRSPHFLLPTGSRGGLVSRIAFLSLPSAALALTLACGGGGGGSSAGAPSITITPNQTSISATLYQGQGSYHGSTLSQVMVSGAYSPVPASEAYPEILSSGVGFVLADTRLFLENGYFTAYFTPDATLAPGTYEGTWSFKLYQDSAMTQAYTVHGGSIPFTVTVTPFLSVNLNAGGTAISGITPANNNQALTVPEGTVIEFDSTASIPISVSYSSGPNMVQVVNPLGNGTDTWTATLSLPAPSINTIGLIVEAQDGSGQNVTVNITVEPTI